MPDRFTDDAGYAGTRNDPENKPEQHFHEKIGLTPCFMNVLTENSEQVIHLARIATALETIAEYCRDDAPRDVTIADNLIEAIGRLRGAVENSGPM